MYARLAPLAVGAALAVAAALTALADEAGLLGAFSIRGDQAWLGGLSGVEVGADGLDIWLLSDRGALFHGQLTRDAGGRVTGLSLGEPEILAARDGDRGTRSLRDSEGIALAPDGRLFISFEGDHRVVQHGPEGDRVLPAAPGFAGLEANGSLEALAVDEAGTLYTLPEVSAGAAIPVFRFAGGRWQEGWSIPRAGSFRPVGADVAGGEFYLLERDFSLLFGFANQIRRFEITPGGLTGGDVVWRSSHGAFSNLEGLSLWRDGQGRLVASMVSDDNFSPILPTELVEIILE
jgi:hypothetical protein